MDPESKGTVLLVDDEPKNLAVLNTYLSESGYEVLAALNGEAALNRVRHILPNIILLDIVMPGMDGFETCLRLKENERTKEIPVLFMSVVANPEEKVKGFEAGAVDFITKPFQVEEVMARVQTHLSLQQMRKEIENKNAALEQEIAVRKRADERLRKYSERLEEMVEERTRELKKAQEELLLKERLAVLGHFAGSISHELRNPLAVIDSSAYFLKMKLGNSDEKINRQLGVISRNVKKSTAIIESLLNLSRMEKPKMEKNDLTDLITETLRSAKIPDTVEVVSDVPDKDIFVDVEIEQVRMALKNIIKNATQAMSDAGKLTITLRSSESGQAELSVADTGPGIPPEQLEKVFEPLFSTRTHGIGFGLSITKMIVENHGGAIRAKSGPGTGATFSITLPMAEKKEQGPGNSAWPSNANNDKLENDNK
ncbi:response regulator [Desulfobacterales bacterium HSG2]|nr:response regulator [Desulfobacterales bacterium HSG2]